MSAIIFITYDFHFAIFANKLVFISVGVVGTTRYSVHRCCCLLFFYLLFYHIFWLSKLLVFIFIKHIAPRTLRTFLSLFAFFCCSFLLLFSLFGHPTQKQTIITNC